MKHFHNFSLSRVLLSTLKPKWLFSFLLWGLCFVGVGVLGDWLYSKGYTWFEKKAQPLASSSPSLNLEEINLEEIYVPPPLEENTKITLELSKMLAVSLLQFFFLGIGFYGSFRLSGFQTPLGKNFLGKRSLRFGSFVFICFVLIALCTVLAIAFWLFFFFWIQAQPWTNSFLSSLEDSEKFMDHTLLVFFGLFWLIPAYFLSHFCFAGLSLIKENTFFSVAFSSSRELGKHNRGKLFILYLLIIFMILLTFLPFIHVLATHFRQAAIFFGVSIANHKSIPRSLLLFLSSPFSEGFTSMDSNKYLFCRLLPSLSAGIGLLWFTSAYQQLQENSKSKIGESL